MNDEDESHEETLQKDSRSLAPPVVVGIGASAGGLAALKSFFSHMPTDPGIAFVVVVHLAPEHQSHLADLLQPHCAMPVRQVSETVPLEPNHVYVIPPGANLNAVDTHLRLSELESQRRKRAPIDHFFRTLASTHDGDSIGIILTGTGSDGTLGLRQIKEHGGLTVVQSPDEAEYDGMPRSALASGFVDVVANLAEIPANILRYVRTSPRVPDPEKGQELSRDDDCLLRKIFAQVRNATGQDFGNYKQSMIMRRIRRRMQLQQVEELRDYLNLLREQRQELERLSNDFLITVTEFFRDTEIFERLEKDYIPQLFEGKKASDSIRVWSVGCSTGEEAYSLAILLLEAAAHAETQPQLQVFASDLHSHSLKKAREGVYPESIETEIAPERLGRFFMKEGDTYRICKEVRELVVFAPHNLLRDPPFSHLDLVVCRNVLIYLQHSVQQDVLRLFHYALRPDGLLLLGTAETVERSELFSSMGDRLCMYRRRNVPPREPHLPIFGVRPVSASGRFPGDSVRSLSYGAMHQQVVEQYAPPSVLVNQDHDVVHCSAHAGEFLQLPGGEPTSSVIKLVREPLRLELRAALQVAQENGTSTRSKPIRMTLGSDQRRVVLRVRPAGDPQMKGFYLILFEEIEAPSEEAPPHQESIGESTNDATGRELEIELDLNRQRLQSVIEEYEHSQEEMQASNEELQSINEELRSTLEELETSKEELQSMNEELTTVNQENRHRVQELSQLSGDLQNLLAATDIATLFLDRELRIVRFTPRVGELFNVRHSDRGRPLSDLTHRLGYTDLHEDGRRVLERLIPVEREVAGENNQWYLTRILPYRSAEDRIEGVVITFIDISGRKQAEIALRESEQRYRTLIAQVEEYAIFSIDRQGRITSWNEGCRRVLGYDRDEFIGLDAAELFTAEDRQAGLPEGELATAITTGSAGGDRWMLAKGGKHFFASDVTTALRDAEGEIFGFSKVLRDQTDQKQAEASLRDSESRLRAALNEQQRIGEFLQQLIETSPVAIAILSGPNLRFTLVNHAYQAFVGDQPLVGRCFAEVFPDAAHRGAEAAIRHVISTGESWRVREFATPVAGREESWWDGEIFRVQSESGATDAALVLTWDVTDRKLAEQEMQAELTDNIRLQEISTRLIREGDFEALLEEILSAAIDLTRADKGTIQLFDSDAGELRMRASRGFALPFLEHFDRIDPAESTGCTRALQSGQRIIITDVASSEIIESDRSREIYQQTGIRAMQSTPLVSRSGRILGIICTHWSEPHDPPERVLRLLDIIARQAADLIERQEAETVLKDADRRKNEFLATLAHELRNPLAPIRTGLEVLRLSLGEPETVEQTLDTMERQMQQMVRLIDDLLDVTRISRGMVQVRKQFCELHRILDNAIESTRPLLEESGIELVVSISPDPMPVDGDPARLAQVFANLLNNAAKYTPAGGRANLSAERQDGYFVINVADTGIGIPPDMLSQVFDMFTQIDSSTERSRSGMGIGLSLVRALVELHGGTVKAFSQGVGMGSEFEVRLPCLETSQQTEPQQFAAPMHQDVQRRRVLVVDDNIDAANILTTMLRMIGHEVHVAHDGLQAVEMADSLRPDIALLDLGLPKIDGYEVARRIRAQPWGSTLTLAAITGWGQEEDRQHSKEAGFDHHCVKPIEISLLESLLAGLP